MELHGQMGRLRHRGRAALLEARRPWDARSARGHRELLRHGLLRDRQGLLRPRAQRHGARYRRRRSRTTSVPGFGEKTDIDLAARPWALFPRRPETEVWQNVPSEATFRGGDHTNMIIGGRRLPDSLCRWPSLRRGSHGRIMRPHLLKEVRNSEGETVVTYEPVVERTPEVTEAHLAYVRDALHGMVQESHSVGGLVRGAGNRRGRQVRHRREAGPERHGLVRGLCPLQRPEVRRGLRGGAGRRRVGYGGACGGRGVMGALHRIAPPARPR